MDKTYCVQITLQQTVFLDINADNGSDALELAHFKLSEATTPYPPVVLEVQLVGGNQHE